MILNIFIKYVEWYYIDKSLEILKKWKNRIVLYFDYFSISVLIKTFFSPWKRVTEDYGRGFDIKKIVETLLFNIMSRIIGAIIRLFFLIIGLIFEIIIIISGFLFFILWIIFPILFLIGIYYSFYLLL